MEGSNANWLGYLAIICWPVVAIGLYSKRPPTEATAWTILGALLLLPIRIELKVPMVPAIDKGSVGSLVALCGCLFAASRTKRLVKIDTRVMLLIAVYICSPVVTSMLNGDPIIVGQTYIPGVDYYDGVSALLSQLILFVPFFLGLRFLSKPEDIETLLRVLVIAALAYSPLMLLEIRLSPQLSSWIYGVSSSFLTEMRYGGFRPVVFLNNGLALAFFLATAVISAAALGRIKKNIGPVPPMGAAGFLGLVLVLCKSAGALVYAVIAGGFVRWFTPKMQVRLAAAIACVAILYPFLRINDVVPTKSLLELASISFNAERAQSLEFRFDQEQQLLSHAYERFWFGWGRYGRNRVYSEYGKDISITDGQWILTFGQFGVIGFIAQFGLLTLPVILAARRLKYARSRRESVLASCLGIVVALSAIEQIPNASISPWSWLLAGSLFGWGSSAASRLASANTAGMPAADQRRVLSGSASALRRQAPVWNRN